MRAHSPTAVAFDFARAVREKDRKSAKKLCTRAAWNIGSPVRESFGLAIQGGLDPRPHDSAYVVGDRATVRVAFMKGPEPTPAAVTYLLMIREGKVWKTHGMCTARAHVALFLAGEADGGGRVDGLPESADARAWAQQLVDTLNADTGGRLDVGISKEHPLMRLVEHLRALSLAHGGCTVVRALWCAQAGRAGVGLRFGRSGSDEVRWVVLQRVDDARGFMVLSMSDKLGMDELVRGSSVDWPPDTGSEEGVMAEKKGGGGKDLSPDQAKVVVEAVVAEAMKSMGYELGPDGKADFSKIAEGDVKAKVPEMMLTLLTNAIEQKKAEAPAAPKPPEPPPPPAAPEPVVDLQAERKKREPAPPREPTQFEKDMQSNLRGAVSDYVSAHVVDDKGPKDVEIDADFLKDHGPALMTELLGAFVKTLVPEDITLDVPVQEEGGKGNKKGKKGDKEQVQMKLDVSALLRSMMTPRPKPDEE